MSRGNVDTNTENDRPSKVVKLNRGTNGMLKHNFIITNLIVNVNIAKFIKNKIIKSLSCASNNVSKIHLKVKKIGLLALSLNIFYHLV